MIALKPVQIVENNKHVLIGILNIICISFWRKVFVVKNEVW